MGGAGDTRSVQWRKASTGEAGGPEERNAKSHEVGRTHSLRKAQEARRGVVCYKLKVFWNR